MTTWFTSSLLASMSPLGSCRAVDFGVSEALARSARLRVVTCLEDPLMSGDPRVAAMAIADQRIERMADLEQRLLGEWPSLKLETHLAEGPPRKALREESGRTDLLIVGREGVNRDLPWLMGSTARSLSRHSHCPIAVIPSSWTACPTARVIVGLENGGRAAAATLRFAGEFADAHASPMLVIADELSEAMLIAEYCSGGDVEGTHAHGDVSAR